MDESTKRYGTGTLRRLALAIAACGAIAVPAAFAHAEGNLELVTPAELPEAARQSGEAMFLKDVGANTFLYIEQDRGARITVLDVTDPSRVRSEGSVELGAAATFDFVAPAGRQGELIRFRAGNGEAVLDLHKPTEPSLKTVQGLALTGPVTDLGAGGFTVAGDTPAARDVGYEYQVVDTSLHGGVARVIDIKDVNEKLAKQDTGTTFLLTDEGLYLIRQPAVEQWKARQDQENLSP